MVQTVSQLQVNCYRKIFKLYSRKEKTAYCAIFRIIVILFHSAHGIRVKLVSNWEQSTVYIKIYKVLQKKKKIDIYVHRLESVVFDMKMCMLQART